MSDPLAVLERHLDEIADELLEAITASNRYHLAATDNTAEPEVRGEAAAHADLADLRWSRALGARAAVEAVYQELAGHPSPQHKGDTAVLARHGLRPNPVGLVDLPWRDDAHDRRDDDGGAR